MQVWWSKTKEHAYWRRADGSYTWNAPEAPSHLACYEKAAKESVKTAIDPSSLRGMCNKWKNELIEKHLRRGSINMDLACGRGGDFKKFKKRDARVIGIDASPLALVEAVRRADGLQLPVNLMCADLTQLKDNAPTLPCKSSTVTCMFALHYLVFNVAEAEALFRFVSASLEPGGVFLGIAPHITNDFSHTYGGDTIRAQFTSTTRYHVHVESNGVTLVDADEFSIDWSNLQRCASKYDLHLLESHRHEKMPFFRSFVFGAPERVQDALKQLLPANSNVQDKPGCFDPGKNGKRCAKRVFVDEDARSKKHRGNQQRRQGRVSNRSRHSERSS